jgi:hypothetical protein
MNEVPTEVLRRLRKICLGLEGVTEEPAWEGIRWVVQKQNFAHVLTIFGGKPAAYARAAKHEGPVVVLTVRSPKAQEAEQGAPFFRAPWGTKWGAQVLGLTLGSKTNWREVKRLVLASHALLSERSTRTRRTSRRSTRD